MNPFTSTFSARLFGAGAVIVLGAVVGRLFGPEARGAIEGIVVLRLGLHAIATLGVPTASTYLVARDPSAFRPAVTTSLALGVAAGIVSGALLAVAAFLHPAWVAPIPPAWFAVFAASAPAVLVTQMEGGCLLGARRVPAWNSLTVVNRAGMLVLLLATAVPALRRIETVVAALVIAEIATLVVALYAVRDAAPLVPRVDRPLFASMRRYGRTSWLHGSLSFFLIRADVLLLGAWGGNQELGQFAAASLAREVVMFLPWVAGMLFLPEVAKATKTVESAALLGPRPRAMGMRSIFVTVSAAALLMLFARAFVVGVHGDAFERAAPLVRILVPAALLAGWGNLRLQELLGRGAPLEAWLAPAAALLVCAAGNLWTIPRYGALGTSWSALAASVVLYAVSTAGVMRARKAAAKAAT